jgi:hypothetical protein
MRNKKFTINESRISGFIPERSLLLAQRTQKITPIGFVDYSHGNTGRPQYQQPNSTLLRQYVGNKIYKNGALERILTDNGYYASGSQAIRDASIKQYPREFQKWYHKYYKGNNRGDATKQELRELYQEWITMGKPNIK